MFAGVLSMANLWRDAAGARPFSNEMSVSTSTNSAAPLLPDHMRLPLTVGSGFPISRRDKGKMMRAFLETTLGPSELEAINAVFESWLVEHEISKLAPEAELAAAIILNLYREGHHARASLESAMSRHRGLTDLSDLA
ncbi:hypothetical protein ACRQ1B_17675 [Rhizobium panacihumi]|jgi:hypothetical protein|uniref:hypothetical protein n=1 Tax=Rhizobium panacihumi TaxID=2008450 RepID=UPI003D7A4559